MQTEAAFSNTHALVLCGGQSSRMGTDKSMLVYHQKPQRYHVYDMLQPFCEKTFISCKHAGIHTIEHGYACLADDHRYTNSGPVAALLTAFEKFPGKNILLVGCDYPFLSTADLRQLASHCHGNRAAGFTNGKTYEPLLAWYPHTLYMELKERFQAGRQSMKQLLEETGAVKVIPENEQSLFSVDTKDKYEMAKDALKR